MKIIHRAIIRELLFTFVLSLLSLNFFLMMERILRLSRLLSGVGASILDMIRIILYIQPQLMMLTIPMSLLLSILLTYGRLNADNELVILRAAGMRFRDIAMPAFAMGVTCFLVGLLVSFYLSPVSAVRLRDSVSRMIAERAPMAIEAGIFNTSFKDMVILVREKPRPDEMRGIFIYDSRDRKEPKVLVAKEGRVYSDREFNLSVYMKDGFIHMARPEGSVEIFFKGYNLSLNLSQDGPAKKSSEMTPIELLSKAKKGDAQETIPLLLEFHRRLSLPSLCLLLMFLGPPLSLLSGKAGRLGGFTIGMGVFTIFHIMLVYSENMARSGKVPDYIGAWAPVIIIGIVSLCAFRRAASR